MTTAMRNGANLTTRAQKRLAPPQPVSSLPSDAVDCFDRGIGFYMDMGRYQMCAKYHKEIAEILEADNQFPEAINHYDNAAQLFESENSPTHANSCKIKVADLAARLDDFDRCVCPAARARRRAALPAPVVAPSLAGNSPSAVVQTPLPSHLAITVPSRRTRR